ncbi:DUF4388 domain-containing protein [bacterium]|nr:DUF4388 domain-containing protein [bacterium]
MELLTMKKAADSKNNHLSSILSGRLEDQGVADIVQFLEIARHTGHLMIDFNDQEGRVDIKKGQVLSASFGSLTGKDAFYSLVAVDSGAFHFISTENVSVTDQIKKRNYALILEALKKVDENGREALLKKVSSSSPDDSSVDDSLDQSEQKQQGLNDYLQSKKLSAKAEPDEQSKWLAKMNTFLENSK